MKVYLPPCDHCGFPVDLRPGTPVHRLPASTEGGAWVKAVDCPIDDEDAVATVTAVPVIQQAFSNGARCYTAAVVSDPYSHHPRAAATHHTVTEHVVWEHASGRWSAWRVEVHDDLGGSLVRYGDLPVASWRELVDQMPDRVAYWLAVAIEPF